MFIFLYSAVLQLSHKEHETHWNRFKHGIVHLHVNLHFCFYDISLLFRIRDCMQFSGCAEWHACLSRAVCQARLCLNHGVTESWFRTVRIVSGRAHRGDGALREWTCAWVNPSSRLTLIEGHKPSAESPEPRSSSTHDPTRLGMGIAMILPIAMLKLYFWNGTDT